MEIDQARSELAQRLAGETAFHDLRIALNAYAERAIDGPAYLASIGTAGWTTVIHEGGVDLYRAEPSGDQTVTVTRQIHGPLYGLRYVETEDVTPRGSVLKITAEHRTLHDAGGDLTLRAHSHDDRQELDRLADLLRTWARTPPPTTSA